MAFSYTLNPLQKYGSALQGWWRSDGVAVNSPGPTDIESVTDLSGNNRPLGNASSGRTVYSANDGGWGGPTIQHIAANNACLSTGAYGNTITIGGPFTVVMVVEQTAAGIFYEHGIDGGEVGGSSVAAYGSNLYTSQIQVSRMNDGSGGTSSNSSVRHPTNLDNGQRIVLVHRYDGTDATNELFMNGTKFPVDTNPSFPANPGSLAVAKWFNIGARRNGGVASIAMSGKWAEAFVLNIAVTDQQACNDSYEFMRTYHCLVASRPRRAMNGLF